VEALPFTRRLHALAGDWADDLLRAIEGELSRNPERGPLVPGLGGVRKARQANPARGKGKRGGFRYFYMYFVRDQQIVLLYILDKDEQEDLTPAQRKLIRALAVAESSR
jgi:mRNA-degrading endonuclease RelE of RelBE toxin-antitoxin system